MGRVEELGCLTLVDMSFGGPFIRYTDILSIRRCAGFNNPLHVLPLRTRDLPTR